MNIVFELPAVKCEVPSSQETRNEAQKERSDQEIFRKERECDLKSVEGNLNYIEQIEQSIHSKVQGDIQKPGRMKIKNVNFEEWEEFPLWREMRDETWAELIGLKALVYQEVGMRLGVSTGIHFQYAALQQDSGSPHGGSEGDGDSDRRERRGRCAHLEQYERIGYPRGVQRVE